MAGESNLMANMYVPTGPAVVVPTSTRDQWCIECQAYHDPMMAHMFTEALIPVSRHPSYDGTDVFVGSTAKAVLASLSSALHCRAYSSSSSSVNRSWMGW